MQFPNRKLLLLDSNKEKESNENRPFFIRLCLNTLQLAAGMKGKVNRAIARREKAGLATAQFRFDTPQLAQRRRLRRVCCGELHYEILIYTIIIIIDF